MQGMRSASVISGISDHDSSSLEALRWGDNPPPPPPLSVPNIVFPSMDTVDAQRVNSWRESRSLSNSGSLCFNYNSHPSSHNASQEVFHPEPVSMPIDHPAHFSPGEPPPLRYKPGMQMPLEYYNNNIPLPPFPAFSPAQFPPVYHNWYQTSMGSIPQEGPSHLIGHSPYDPRSMQSQWHPSCHNSATELSQTSQPTQPMLNYQYYTPPHSRRNTAMVGSNHRASPIRHQSISEHPDGAGVAHEYKQLSPKLLVSESRAGHSTHRERQIRGEWDDDNEAASKVASASDTGSVLNEKQLQVHKGEVSQFKLRTVSPYDQKNTNHNSADYVTSLPCNQAKTRLKGRANLEELTQVRANMENNGETVTRRRTNSLHRDSDRSTRYMKATNRLSFQSVDERHPCKEFQLLQTNPMHRSASTSCNANESMSANGSINLDESKISGSKSKCIEYIL